MEGGSIHRLPDLGSEARASMGIDARSDSTPARGCWLIADDHALLRTGMRAMLEAEPDLEVVGEAGNGREAVDLCRELLPDLVLMDLSMPEMDGWEVARAVRRRSPRTRIAVVTGYGLDAARTQGDAPADAVIGKPFDFEQVEETLARLSGKT